MRSAVGTSYGCKKRHRQRFNVRVMEARFFRPSWRVWQKGANTRCEVTPRKHERNGWQDVTDGNDNETVSYDEYFRQIFGGLGVLPVFWNSQELSLIHI